MLAILKPLRRLLVAAVLLAPIAALHAAEQTKVYRWNYARSVEDVDRQIGLVMEAMEQSGLADDTLVVFTSDHGDMNGAHRRGQKMMPYEMEQDPGEMRNLAVDPAMQPQLRAARQQLKQAHALVGAQLPTRISIPEDPSGQPHADH